MLRWLLYYRERKKVSAIRKFSTVFWPHVNQEIHKQSLNKEDKELLIEWVSNYTRLERQRTARQETTMSKMGTFPFYFYKKDICKEAFERGIYTNPQSSNSSNENEIENYSDSAENENIEEE